MSTKIIQNDGLSTIVSRFLNNYISAHEPGILPPPGLYARILKEVEKPLFEAALSITDGNQKKAAEVLGIHRDTLRKKLVEYGLLAG